MGLPTETWQHLAVDLCGPLTINYHLLVLVDYDSRFVKVDVTTKIDSVGMIKRIEAIFARFCLSISISGDTGRKFVSEEFKRYCEV